MDRKYKLLIASSLVSVIATGCSSYGSRGNADPQTNVTGSGGYTSQQAATKTVSDNNVQVTSNGRTQQWYIDQYNRNKAAGTNNGRSQQWYIDQYNREQAAKNAKTNTVTNGRSQQWYIDQYNRQQAAAKQKQMQQQTQQQAQVTNGRTRQWYVDRFNRQQAANAGVAGYVPPKPIVVKPYVAPTYTPPKPIAYVAPAPATKTQTQYVDYTGGVAATATTPTNKNLYTGSYQQPNTTYQQYQPKTYTGGASSGNTATTANTGGAGAYVVKKGDTVFEVMRQTGVYWKEIISMNNLQAPTYTIQPGQTLRLR